MKINISISSLVLEKFKRNKCISYDIENCYEYRGNHYYQSKTSENSGIYIYIYILLAKYRK